MAPTAMAANSTPSRTIAAMIVFSIIALTPGSDQTFRAEKQVLDYRTSPAGAKRKQKKHCFFPLSG
jgi:hypothetical protein